MVDAAVSVEDVLDEVASLVAERVRGAGWVRRPPGASPWFLALTNEVGAGVIATAVLSRTEFSLPLRWPVPVGVMFGAGYEPALGLTPLLTLAPRFALIGDPTGERPELALSGPQDVQRVAAALAEAVVAHGTGFAAGYDVDRFARELGEPDRAVTALLVLLAATRRHERARELLEQTTSDGDKDDPTPRVARQLRRWLDAGGPPIPAVEDTLRRLPARPARPRDPSWSDARQKAAAKKAAYDAVTAVARGKSRDELMQLLADEHAARGLDISPSALAVNAETIQVGLGPFGRARQAVRALRMVTELGSDAVHLVRGHGESDPDWLRPPEYASYPIQAGSSYASVSIDPYAGPVLARVAAEAPRHLGDLVLVDLWLTSGTGGAITVRLGEHTVGGLPSETAAAYAADLIAAHDIFDEAPQVPGRLLPASADTPAILEIALPDHP